MRKISKSERELVERILDFDQRYRGQIPLILENAFVREVPSEGTIQILNFAEENSESTLRKYPVEAQTKDVDGVYIHALIFIKNDQVTELEIFKDDSSEILNIPLADKWELVDLG